MAISAEGLTGDLPVVDIDDATVVHYANGLLDRVGTLPGEAVLFSLPRLKLTASIASAGYAALCRRALVDDARNGDAQQSAMHVAVVDHATQSELPRARWSAPSFGMGQFVRRLEASGLAGSFDAEHGIWQFHAPRRSCGIQTLQHAGQFPPWEAGFPLRNFLHWGYQAQGMRLVHAGTLGHQGRGVLLAGAGGAGKSGTTLAGISHGLTSVGDDYIAIAQDASCATAYPVMRLMKQDQQGLARLGIDPVGRALGTPNWQGKYEFDFAELVAGARAPSLALTAILLPRITDRAKCRILPAPMRDALYGLLPNNMGQLPDGLRQCLSFVTGLAKALPAYHLELGSEPEDIAQTIARFLEGSPS